MSNHPLVSGPGNGGSKPPGFLALEVTNVTKCYGDFKAVSDLSFALPAGSICGFLGPNGAGKTTTIRMILEIIRPTIGAITVLGGNSALSVRNRIGYLPEEKGLYKKMKAWSIIAYFARLKGMSRSKARHQAYELLTRYGLKEACEKPVDALSKGMAQKVQMLASIAHDPELIILDEPFSGLDPVNQQVMEEIIRELTDRGRTILFSTHVMQHAERLCERILLLAEGRKIFDGPIAAAKRILPRRVVIETDDDIQPMRSLPEILTIRPTPNPSANNSAARWEIEIREQSDPQLILQTCFARGIRLRSFQQSDPTLHDVFVHLVENTGKESQ